MAIIWIDLDTVIPRFMQPRYTAYERFRFTVKFRVKIPQTTRSDYLKIHVAAHDGHESIN